MKTFNHRKYITVLLMMAATFLSVGCDSELEDEAALQVDVKTSANVQVNGSTITVKKGTPVDFLFSGDPDFITFFSGETGQKYEYRNRTQVDPEDIESSRLTFSVWMQYGNAKTAAGALSMYISDAFGGLYKNDFERDSMQVESFDWQELVPQDALPQAPASAAKATSFDLDMAAYLGKTFTIAVKYQPQDNSAAQPRVNFVGMLIKNKMKDGTETTLYASNFGFTPVNMCNRMQLSDQKSMTANRSYGTVTNNTSGIWNMVNASSGNFFIHSSGAKAVLKYSWLVSDAIMTNACSPDQGINIKNIAQALNSYSYTYEKAGTYKAVFLGTNANFKGESKVIQEVTVQVVE